jgi:hypothetical protein
VIEGESADGAEVIGIDNATRDATTTKGGSITRYLAVIERDCAFDVEDGATGGASPSP